MKNFYIVYFLLCFHLLDAFHLEYHEPKTYTHSLAPNFIELLKDVFHISTFVETGTFMGNTVNNALPFMKHIYSIELAPHLYEQAVEKFKEYTQVKIMLGSSDQLFPELLAKIDRSQRICFWLDGHYSEGETAKGNKFTPLVEELEAIKNAEIKNALILVDDIRACIESATDYPSVRELKELIRAINPDYQFYIYGDIALACLPTDNISVSPLISLMTTLYLLVDISEKEKVAFDNIQRKFQVFPSIIKYLKPAVS